MCIIIIIIIIIINIVRAKTNIPIANETDRLNKKNNYSKCLCFIKNTYYYIFIGNKTASFVLMYSTYNII